MLKSAIDLPAAGGERFLQNEQGGGDEKQGQGITADLYAESDRVGRQRQHEERGHGADAAGDTAQPEEQEQRKQTAGENRHEAERQFGPADAADGEGDELEERRMSDGEGIVECLTQGAKRVHGDFDFVGIQVIESGEPDPDDESDDENEGDKRNFPAVEAAFGGCQREVYL